MSHKDVSKRMSYLLRHDNEDLKMDNDGYVLVEDLLKKLECDQEKLDSVVSENDKKRFSYTDDKVYIRAVQGHTLPFVKIKFTEVTDTKLVLYHGTSYASFLKIEKKGLLPMKRQYVHLTLDPKVAEETGMRYAKRKMDLVLLSVLSKDLIDNKIKLYISDNNVYLSDPIPFKLIKGTLFH